MRYLIIIVFVVLAGVMLVPIFIQIGKRLSGYFNSAMSYEQDNTIDTEDEIEELKLEDKDGV